ncbi:MAG: lipid-A-disaccharide synthase [Saprospiraceae bacterium]|nr:lipid-A-disaccharide synthase [Saprospiraceae bacterium]
MKLYIISGEASGDLHGSNLVKALLQKRPGTEIRAWGGDLMSGAGATVVKHYRDLAFMGFMEVLRNLRTIFHNLAFCKKDILAFQPDALVLIDYPGFNLRIAKWAKSQGIRVYYYISPQVWAWHQSRVHDIRRDVDEMIVILPFEKDFFARHGVNAHYVGHPLLDVIDAGLRWKGEGAVEIALLPGSRKQEVLRILPVMAAVAARFPEYTFTVAGSPTLPDALYGEILSQYPNITLRKGETYAILQRARAALVKSGTSTLETALIGTPQVVCYAGNPLSFAIAKRIVRVPYISLVNLIADQPMVQELIQHDLTPDNLENALKKILQPSETTRLQTGYQHLRELLGGGGASERAAGIVLGG